VEASNNRNDPVEGKGWLSPVLLITNSKLPSEIISAREKFSGFGDKHGMLATSKNIGDVGYRNLVWSSEGSHSIFASYS
jgi:hypothetical protein